MTSLPANPATAPGQSAEHLPSAKSLSRRAIEDTFSRPGARTGLIWLAVLGVLGAFAPFVANSHPVALKMDGRWSSPMWVHLTPADVTIAIVAVTAIVLILCRCRFSRIMLALLAELAIVVPLALWLIHPPQTVVYEQYREWERAGRVEKIYRTIIPFPPTTACATCRKSD